MICLYTYLGKKRDKRINKKQNVALKKWKTELRIYNVPNLSIPALNACALYLQNGRCVTFFPACSLPSTIGHFGKQDARLDGSQLCSNRPALSYLNRKQWVFNK